MKKSIFLVVLLCVAIFGSNRAYSVELDTVWVSDEYGSVIFQHPISKNIVIQGFGNVKELDSKNGKLVREFPINTDYGVDISTDGGKILTSVDETDVYDFISLEKIDNIKSANIPKFFGNNKIIFRNIGTQNDEFNLGVYDLQTKEKKVYSFGNLITAISVSPDSKHIVIATKERDGEEVVRLLIINAETMQVIKELGSWNSEGHSINNLRFSQNSKYLTYYTTNYSTFGLKIFDVNSLKTIKEYSVFNTDFTSARIEFLKDDLILFNGLKVINGNRISNCELIDLALNKILHTFDILMVATIYDSNKNLLFGDIPLNKKTYCLDFTNIITGVQTINPVSYQIDYKNKILTIKSSNDFLKNIKISNLEGKIFFSHTLTAGANELQVPLIIPNGAYLIYIHTTTNNFTHKLLVME
jgi:hypothetical protein